MRFLAATPGSIGRSCWAWTDSRGPRDLSARTALLSDEAIRALDLEEYVREKYRDTLAQVPYSAGGVKERSGADGEMSFLNLRWFMQTLLDRMDRTSMAWGLEARVPFADHRIVEYAADVPMEHEV